MAQANKSLQIFSSRGRRRVRRWGAAMAAVLVCLLVIMLIAGTLVRSMLLYQRQAKQEVRQLQTLWLSESAAALAVAQLRADPNYQGQTWRPMVDATTGARGVAEIAVEPVDGEPRRRFVQIKSIYPDDPVHRVVRESNIAVSLPATGESE